MTRVKRVGAAIALVVFAASGVSSSEAAPRGSSPASAQVSTPGETTTVGRSLAKTSPRPPVARVAATHTRSVAAPTSPATVSPKTTTPARTHTSAKAAPLTKPVTKRPATRTFTRPKATKRHAPAHTPVLRTPVKRKPAPTQPPAPQPTNTPKPTPTQPTASTYAAPTISYTGSTCRKTGTGQWTITHRWAATGGTYTDLGSAQDRITPVTVTGDTRTWTFQTTEIGSEAPDLTDAHLGRIIAPNGKSGDVTAWKSIERTVDMVPVSC